MLAVAAAIIGLAGPVLNPRDAGEAAARGPLLIVVEDSWAAARDWQAQRGVIDALLAEAARDGRVAALLRLSAPEAPVFQAAQVIRTRLPKVVSKPAGFPTVSPARRARRSLPRSRRAAPSPCTRARARSWPLPRRCCVTAWSR
jgi:hypothetical protein